MKKLVLIAAILLCVCAFCSCTATPPQITDQPPVVDDTESVATEAPEPVAPVLLPIFLDKSNGNDENDGTSADKAIATLEKAYTLLEGDRSLIVLVSGLSEQKLPAYDGVVTFTSLYDGVDYGKTNGARFRVSDLKLGGDTAFENIEFYVGGATARICCNYNNLYIGESVSVGVTSGRSIGIIGGYFVTDFALNGRAPMIASDVSHKGDCTISVMSGTWSYIVGGNYRAGMNSPVGTFDGNLTLNIGGTAEVISQGREDDVAADVVAAGGANIHKGAITLNISGGTFNCPVYALGKLGKYYNATTDNGYTGTDGLHYGSDVKYKVDIAVNITGGNFAADNCSVIGALQVAGETAVHGDYTLNVMGGTFGSGITFSAFGVYGNSTAIGIPNEGNVEAECFTALNGSTVNVARPVRVACVGDSITFGTCAKETMINRYAYSKHNFSYPAILQKMYGTDVVVGNFGYPGAVIHNTWQTKYYKSCSYNMFTTFEPDIIVIALGTNNAASIASGRSEFIGSYKSMLNQMHKMYPNAKIILTTALYRWDSAERTTQVQTLVIPTQKEIANNFDYVTLFDTYTKFKRYGNAQYYSDAVHPNNLGYEKLAEIIKTAVDSALAN